MMSRFCPPRCLNTSLTAPFYKWQDPDTLNDYLHCMTTSYFLSSCHEPCECPMDPSCRRRFDAGRAWFGSAIKCHFRIGQGPFIPARNDEWWAVFCDKDDHKRRKSTVLVLIHSWRKRCSTKGDL